ncbi:peptidylprolyl isomerase [Actinophytocola glycyrrhizae]|uniref:peptidylprolyl isomerase n=1 Tax=Actinophytocola glycyrrhizae TaxID=2044873 RepID=A0ABV9S6I3_9PSEU
MRIDHTRSPVLDLFLLMQRELHDRFSFEAMLLPRPQVPEVAAFWNGFELWAPIVRNNIPSAVADAPEPAKLTALITDERLAAGAELITTAMVAAEPTLMPVIAQHEELRARAAADLDEVLDPDHYLGPLCQALGTPATSRTLALHLVPYAPHTPSVGYLVESETLTGLYVDCNRFRGATMADSVLTLLGWAHLIETRDDPANLSVELARRLPGSAPYQRRLRVLLSKILVEMLAGHLVRDVRPEHRPCFDVLGSQWRYPRLFAVAQRHWARYLRGDLSRADALVGIADDLAAYSPRWFVDHIDPSSLAADFYLLEWMAAEGNGAARKHLAAWLPQLCADLAGHLDVAIGSELGHFGRMPLDLCAPPLAHFLREVGTGDSRVAWPRLRSELGHATALEFARQAFAGPGVEFGGMAWHPITEMVERYVTRELPDRVFVDQCFTLEHNNGSVFDKFYDVQDMPTVLDAQARTDVDTLSRHASAAVRSLLRHHRERSQASVSEPDNWFELSLHQARPGGLGCGNRAEPGEFDPVHDPFLHNAVNVRRMRVRSPVPSSLTTYRSARVVLHTTMGDVCVELWPDTAPYTVDNFVGLAGGGREWVDPRTGKPGEGGFYDGTAFHRRVPGFCVNGGDRRGTGEGSAGYRWFEEITTGPAFDQPFRVAMLNRAGPGSGSTGSQFFITVAPAPHLEGAYAVFGEVSGEPCRQVVLRISESPVPVVIESTTVTATPAT